MNDIEPEDDGNMQTGFLHGDVLEPVNLLDIHLPENRTDATVGNQIVRLFCPDSRHHYS